MPDNIHYMGSNTLLIGEDSGEHGLAPTWMLSACR